MSGIELQRYIQELAAETAAAASGMPAEERQDFVLGKMALLQTYLTSTGRSDASAFEVVKDFQKMVDERIKSEAHQELQSGAA